MPRNTKMTDIRNIIKIYEDGLTSSRAISRITGVSKNTVTTIITKAKAGNITYSSIANIIDDKLYKVFYPNNTNIQVIHKIPVYEKESNNTPKTI